MDAPGNARIFTDLRGCTMELGGAFRIKLTSAFRQGSWSLGITSRLAKRMG